MTEKQILNPDYVNNNLVDLVLGSLKKIIKMEYWGGGEIDNPVRVILCFVGITQISIANIPKNSRVCGSIDGDRVKLVIWTNMSGPSEIFRVMLPEPILIFDKNKL